MLNFIRALLPFRGDVAVLSEDLTGICVQQNCPTRAEINVTIGGLELD